MRKFRNPRYASEWTLERKLSPSDLVGNLATVAVYSAPSTSSFDPPPPPPPDTIPVDPTGPAGPA